MTTYTTGIPRMRRNIQPPPIPVVKLTVNKTITGYPLDNTQFFLRITLPSGFTLTGIPFSQSVPFVMESLQYGTYTIEEEVLENYLQVSITPSTFTLSAENPQQTVEVVNLLNLGVITVTKLITGVTEDETYFDIVVTGQGLDPIEQSGQVRLGEPLVFYDLPLDDYVITELPVEGYILTSITPSSVTIAEGELSKGIVVVNDSALGLKIEWDNIINAPEFTLEDYNTYYNLPTNGSEFTVLATNGNVQWLAGGENITNAPNPNIHLAVFDDEVGCIIDAIGFYGCEILTYASLPSITDLKEQFFRYNYVLSNVNLPNVTHVRGSAFGYCYILTKIILPEATHLYMNAFYVCYLLNEIYIPKVYYFEPTDGTYSVFYTITGRVLKLTINASLMTSNGGNPQVDIQYLIDNNTTTIFDPLGNQIYP